LRILSLYINGWKNSGGFSVEFDTRGGLSIITDSTGVGTSAFLEAIASIFRNIDLRLPIPFAFSLIYECRGTKIAIDAEAFSKLFIRRNEGDGWMDC